MFTRIDPTHSRPRLPEAITVEHVLAGAAVGALLLALRRLAVGKAFNRKSFPRCNADKSRVWRFLVGCDVHQPVTTGMALDSAYHSHRYVRVGLCAVCAAMEAAERAVGSPSYPEWQDLLLEWQAFRGVDDYRGYKTPKTWAPWHALARDRASTAPQVGVPARDDGPGDPCGEAA
jgi:hypothetical protein